MKKKTWSLSVKQGDLVRYKDCISFCSPGEIRTIYIVRWVERKNDWVCVYGIEPPLMMSMMETVSETG